MPSPEAAKPDDHETSRLFLAGLVAVTFVMNTVGRGVTETFAVFLLPVEKALGASRADMALTYSIFMLGYAIAAPFAGQLIDRLGARITYAAGLLALGLGYWLSASATNLWHIYAGIGLLGGLGVAALGMVTASALLSRWFSQRLGTVASLPYAAVGFGMLLIPPAAQLLIDAGGWQSAYRWLGLATLAVIPALFLLPLGRYSRGSDAWRNARAERQTSGDSVWTVSTAMRTGAFWALFLVYFMTSVAAYSVLPHSVAHLVEQGFSPLAAAGAFGMTGMLSTIGIIAIGWLSDRQGRRTAATLSYLSTILGITALIAIAWSPSLLLMYAFVVFFGLMQGARGPILVALIAKIFPGGSIGSIFGTLSMALGTGAALGSWASGLLHQMTGSYTASFTLAIAAACIGTLAFWVVPSLRQERVVR